MTDYHIIPQSVRIWMGLFARILVLGETNNISPIPQKVPATNQSTVPPKLTLRGQ